MKIIEAVNVNEALEKGIQLIENEGLYKFSRNGNTLEIPCPVTTVYRRPWERVLFCPERDANPFFHFFESLWILAGRSDVNFLNEFNKRMIDYSDDGSIFNAPYGWRLRTCFAQDQIKNTINILRNDINSRQIVLQIWNTGDLIKKTRDKACNLCVIFYVRNGLLEMTVYNRSNDMIWGCYGANAVQFSMLQEYVSAHTRIPIGNYYQVSNSFHVYTTGPAGRTWDKLKELPMSSFPNHYKNNSLINNFISIGEPQFFDEDLKEFFMYYDIYSLKDTLGTYRSHYFNKLVVPMLETHLTYKRGNKKLALEYTSNILSDDWKIACKEWIERRI